MKREKIDKASRGTGIRVISVGKQVRKRPEAPRTFPVSSIRWSTDREFEEQVFPSAFRNNDHVRLSHGLYTLAGWLQEANYEAGDLYDVTNELRKLLESAKDPSARVINKAVEACIVGERVLLHNKRLALSEYAEEFLHIKDAFASENDNRNRAGRWDLSSLLRGLEDLTRGLNVLQKEDEFFLVLEPDLPRDLMADFYTARDCFSVGLDEPGLFVAGRGLEGVLRRFLRNRKVELQRKGRKTPAAEADFYDVIEVSRRLKWQKSGKPVFSQDTIQLLHWLRSIRNSEAHPASRKSSSKPRTQATLFAEAAASVWHIHSSNARAKLRDTSIDLS